MNQTTPFWQRWFQHKGTVALILVVAVAVIYSFMLNGLFKTVDDEVSIVFNPAIRDLSGLPHIFSSSFFGQGSFYRPLVMVSFMMDYAMGGLDPFYYHLTNLILHAMNACLVFYTIDRISQSRNISAWTAILFAIHPIQWEAVSNIAGRSVLLSTFFSLITWLVFMHWDKRKGAHWLLLTIVTFIAALLSKEAAVTVPILLLWTTLFFGDGRRGSMPKLGKNLLLSCIKVAPFVIIVLVYLMLRQDLGIMRLSSWLSWQEHVLSVITFLNGLLRYIGIFLFPVDLHFYRTQWIIMSWANPVLWGTIMVWCLLLLQLWRTRQRWCSRVWFVLGFIAIELILISQVLTPLHTQPGVISLAEHLFYMPAIPILMFLVMTVRLIGNNYLLKHQRYQRIYPLVIGVFLIFYVATTICYARHATNEITMLKRAVSYEPWHNRNHFSLGLLYVKLQQLDVAEAHFRKALHFHPLDPRALIGLARTLVEQDRIPEALAIYNNIKHVPSDLQPLLDEHIQSAEKLLLEKK